LKRPKRAKGVGQELYILLLQKGIPSSMALKYIYVSNLTNK